MGQSEIWKAESRRRQSSELKAEIGGKCQKSEVSQHKSRNWENGHAEITQSKTEIRNI